MPVPVSSLTVEVPWAEERSRFTQLFECWTLEGFFDENPARQVKSVLTDGAALRSLKREQPLLDRAPCTGRFFTRCIPTFNIARALASIIHKATGWFNNWSLFVGLKLYFSVI